ncbi:hypothetical protein JSR02_00230 [Candidatus Vidania fulgoroideae]|uniref:Uncharacterized protein n=1 Tax=Candidatus Vidania fulgoroideorum TaxID=881286 RepID=A0A975AEF2_9PROT|nr:hypothetical protein JSR02_00230 [Candidatus Vidania fulgoroideae]
MYLVTKPILSKVINKTTIGIIKNSNTNWLTHSTNRAVLVKNTKVTHGCNTHTEYKRGTIYIQYIRKKDNKNSRNNITTSHNDNDYNKTTKKKL